jgi:hypothetical protein
MKHYSPRPIAKSVPYLVHFNVVFVELHKIKETEKAFFMPEFI